MEKRSDTFKHKVIILIARVNYVIKSTVFKITPGYFQFHYIFI